MFPFRGQGVSLLSSVSGQDRRIGRLDLPEGRGLWGENQVLVSLE